MNQVKLRKCNICGEWFNATQSIMFEHYKLKHKFAADKTFKIAELIIKRELLSLKAKFAPFPESLILTMEAVAVNAQLQMVVLQSEKKFDSESYTVCPNIK